MPQRVWAIKMVHAAYKPDIESQAAEKGLPESSRLLEMTFDSLRDAVFILDAPTTQIIDCNPAASEIFGYTRQEMLGRTTGFLHVDEARLAKFREHLFAALREKSFLDQFEFRMKGKNGIIFPTEHTVLPVEDGQGNRTYWISIVRDVSDRKRAKQALQESEQRYRGLVESANDAIFTLSTSGEIISLNPAFERLTSWSRAEWIGRPFANILHPEDLPHAMDSFKNLVKGEPAFMLELRVLTKSRDYRTGEFQVAPLIEHGKVIGVQGIARDITVRKEAEEALRRSEQTARRFAQESATMAEIGRIVSSTLNVDEVYERFAMEVRKLMPFDRIAIHLLNPDNRTATIAYVSGLQIENQRRGDVIPLKGSLNEEILLTRSSLLISPEDEEELAIRLSGLSSAYKSHFRSGLSVPLISKDQVIGVLHFLSNQSGAYSETDLRLAEEVGNEIAGAIANAQLFAACKSAEKALRESEGKYYMVVEHANQGIFIIQDGMVKFPNPKVCEIFGFSPGELTSKPLIGFVYPDDREPVARYHQRRLEDRDPRHTFAFRVIDKSGRIKWIEMSDALITWEGRNATLSFLSDITARKEAEDERERLLKQVRVGRERLRTLSRRLVEVQESERRYITQELHDRIGQNLTALGINLNIIRSQLSAALARTLGPRLDESQKLLEETVERIRDIMAEMRPPMLDDYGLMATLRWYGELFSKSTGVATAIRGEESTPRLPLTIETALFRITQEALTNVAKHAQAKLVTLTLEALAGSVRLTIADDGIGFDSTAHHRPGKRPEWGLITIRERAQAVGGSLSVKTSPGMGTHIIVEVPR